MVNYSAKRSPSSPEIALQRPAAQQPPVHPPVLGYDSTTVRPASNRSARSASTPRAGGDPGGTSGLLPQVPARKGVATPALEGSAEPSALRPSPPDRRPRADSADLPFSFGAVRALALPRPEALGPPGPAGVGKTHLAVALGVRAIESGFSVGFYHLDDLMHDLKQDAEVPPTRVKGKKYRRNSLLIIDEVGFRQLTRLEASLFFRLVRWRYQKGSTLITTNKAVKDWPEVFAGDEVMVTALLDRLHRCHVFNIKGKSYRLRELEQQIK